MRPIMISRLFYICIIFPCIFLFISSTYAGEAVNISADQLEYISKTNSYIAKGSAKIFFKDTILIADEIHLNNETFDAVAIGNVQYEDIDALIKTDRVEINLKTKLGNIGNSYIFYKNDNYHLNAEGVTKIGEKLFELEKAKITTCDANSPAWDFTSKNITIIQHKKLFAKNTILHIKDIPVFYTPYFWAPLTEDRSSGLLLPLLGYSSKNGYYYKQGLFWAMREDQDATLYLDSYADKGLAKGIDYRYAFTSETNGEIWMYHAKDQDQDKDLFEFKSYVNQKLPYDTSSYLKIHTVNTSDYYTSMDSTSQNRIGLESLKMDPFGFASEESLQKYLESNLHISKDFQSGRTYFLGQYKRSLEGSSSSIPQNLPEIGLIVNTMSRGPASFNMSMKGINFWRDEEQKGQRFDINPNINLSYGRLVNLTQKIGLRETAYYLKNPSITKYRTMLDLRTTLNTKLFRQYPSFVHIAEPAIEYVYIPPVDNDNIPSFDSIDSLSHTSRIYYSLTNRISSLSVQRLETRLRLSQNYNLLNIEKKFSPLLAEANISIDHLDFKLNASYDVHDENVSETIADVALHGQDVFLAIGKNFRRVTSLSQLTLEAGANRPLKLLPIDLKTKLWYDLHGNGVQQFNVETAYKRQCWGIIISYDRSPLEYKVSFAIEFKGLATLSL